MKYVAISETLYRLSEKNYEEFHKHLLKARSDRLHWAVAMKYAEEYGKEVGKVEQYTH